MMQYLLVYGENMFKFIYLMSFFIAFNLSFSLKASFIAQLPTEVQALILHYVSIRDIFNYCATSKETQKICENDTLWRVLVERDFAYIDKPLNMTWKEYYQSHFGLHQNALAVGRNFGCVIMLDKTVQCFGASPYGVNDVPADLGQVKAISSSSTSDHVCAIKSDGTGQCWGRNSHQQSLVPADLGEIEAISAGHDHTCVIKEDTKTVRCFGDNSAGQSTPPDNLGPVKAIAAGHRTTCAITIDGDLNCWGVFDTKVDMPPDLGKVKAVSMGEHNMCVITKEGIGRCWGSSVPFIREKINNLGPVKAISVGVDQICFIKNDRKVSCYAGTYGTGSSSNRITALMNFGNFGEASAIAAGAEFTCAMKNYGELGCSSYFTLSVPKDLHWTSKNNIGDRIALDEAGFNQLSSLGNVAQMAKFIKRLIGQLELKSVSSTDESFLLGLAQWYVMERAGVSIPVQGKLHDPRKFEELVQELTALNSK
jgi:hypothetical protein